MVPGPGRLILVVMLALAIGLEARPAQQGPQAQQTPPPSPEVEALAAKLVDEPDAAGRDALLSANGRLVGPPLLQALLLAGRDARNRGAIERVRKIYEVMADVAIKANVPVQHALALNNIGLISYDQGDYQDALDWYAKSLAISEQIGDENGMARTLNNMGAAYSFANALDTARIPLERSLALGEKLKTPRLVSNALNNLAILDGMRGDYARALAVLQRSYEIEAPGGSKRNLATTRLNIGNLYFNQGDDTQAGQQFEQALKLAEEGGIKQLSAIAMLQLGSVAQARGDLAEAVRQLEQALVIFREINDKPNIANALSVLATVLGERGQYERGVELLREAVGLQKGIGGYELSRILTRLAALQNRMKSYRDALATADQAISLGAGGFEVAAPQVFAQLARRRQKARRCQPISVSQPGR